MGIITIVSVIIIIAVFAIAFFSQDFKPRLDTSLNNQLVNDRTWTLLLTTFDEAIQQLIQNQHYSLTSIPGTPNAQFDDRFLTKTHVLTDRTHHTVEVTLGLNRHNNQLHLALKLIDSSTERHQALCTVCSLTEGSSSEAVLSVGHGVFHEGTYKELLGIFFSELASTLKSFEEEHNIPALVYQTPEALTIQAKTIIYSYDKSTERLDIYSVLQSMLAHLTALSEESFVTQPQIFQTRWWSHTEHLFVKDGPRERFHQLCYFLEPHLAPQYEHLVHELVRPLLNGKDRDITRMVLQRIPTLLMDMDDAPMITLKKLHADMAHNILGDHLSTSYGELLSAHLTDQRVPIALRAHFLIATSRTKQKNEYESVLNQFVSNCSIFEVHAFFAHLNKARPADAIAPTLSSVNFAAFTDRKLDQVAMQECVGLVDKATQLMIFALTEELLPLDVADEQCAALLQLFYKDGLLWEDGAIQLMTGQRFSNLIISMRAFCDIKSLHALYGARDDARITGLLQSSIVKVIKQMEKRLKASRQDMVGSLSLDSHTGQAGDLSIAQPVAGQLSISDDVTPS